jgi:hypothetical protein
MAADRLASRGVLIPATAAAASFGAITSIATGAHYHVNCNDHGLVDGGSTSDSAYHSRVEGGPCHASSSCSIGQFNTIIYYGAASVGFTCDQFVSGYGPECAGFARVALTGRFAEHRHDAHDPC